ASRPSRSRDRAQAVDASASMGGRSSTSLARSAAYELRREEAARARGFATAVLVLCGLIVIVEPFIEGVWWLRGLTMACVTVVSGTAGYVWTFTREPQKYTRAIARAFAVTTLLGSIALTYRFG